MVENKVPMNQSTAPRCSAIWLSLHRYQEILQIIVGESSSRYTRIKRSKKQALSRQCGKTQVHKIPLPLTEIWVNAGICRLESSNSVMAWGAKKPATEICWACTGKNKKAWGQERNVFATFLGHKSPHFTNNKIKGIRPLSDPWEEQQMAGSHFQERSITNSKNEVFPTLSYPWDVTIMQRRRQAQLSLLRHSSSATARQERGGCENGSSAPESRLWSLVRADKVMFWVSCCCLTVSSVWLSSSAVNSHPVDKAELSSLAERQAELLHTCVLLLQIKGPDWSPN